jgi:hypothetical protein
MQDILLVAASVGVPVVLALAGWLVAANRNAMKSNAEALTGMTAAVMGQGQQLARVEEKVSSVVADVDELKRYRDEQQRRELEELRAAVRRSADGEQRQTRVGGL